MSPGTFLFVVNGEASVGAAGPDLNPAYQEKRPGGKRPHVKSRRGCLVCKQRRVKVSGTATTNNLII